MNWALHLLIPLVAILGAAWLVVVLAMCIARLRGQPMNGLLPVLLDVLRLIGRLARDPSLPRSVRWRLWLALAYSAQPFNLIPDFIPVIGFADNALIIAWALRSVLRKADAGTIAGHWTGSAAGLSAVYRVVGLERPPELSVEPVGEGGRAGGCSGRTIDDTDLVETSETFAAQAIPSALVPGVD